MRFFHYTDKPCDRLDPAIGGARHDGEDPRAVNKPVVWLSNEPMRREERNGRTSAHQHEVEVDLTDPLLLEDEKFAALSRDFNQAFSTSIGPALSLRWFFYLGALPVVARSLWNGSEYVPDPAFTPVHSHS